MKKWLGETHGANLELLRHFLLRFFDSEIVTTPGQATTTLIWAFSIIVPWFLIFGSALFRKYRFFSTLPTPTPYRLALKADELWLVTLMMASVGLLAAVKWQALFPGLRDYRALGSLPLRPRQIFVAKLTALLLVTTAAVLTLNATPDLMFPMVSGGKWALEPSLAGRIRAHAAASIGGCYFFFFAIVAAQGVMLAVLRPRAFGRLSGTMQGLFIAAMLILMVLSFSIGPPQMKAIEGSSAAQWFPPLWFVGLDQTLLGDPDPHMRTLANRATGGLEIALLVAIVSYLVSYRRHREWMVEGAAGPSHDRRWTGAALDVLIASPRQQAVVVFLWKTLLRSSQHRIILMGYCGFAVAVIAAGLLGIGALWNSARALAGCFVYTHVIMLMFLLIGARHLFSIPTELRANWMFQITEGEGRDEWLDAVDRFVLWVGAAVVVALPFPIEVQLIGWRAVAESALFVAIGLLLYEWLFAEWRKLPFTCSHLPGKTPLWITTLYGIGLVTFIPIVNAMVAASLFSAAGFTAVLALTTIAWRRIRTARRESWGELRLKYDEAPDPAIHGLGLGQ